MTTPNRREHNHPNVPTNGARDGRDDPHTDPTRIDWPTRQAHAAIPFEVVNGRPINPYQPTGIRYGRNQLRHWGEALCADALVISHDPGGCRWIVMVERGDGHGWALPGGHVEPGEDPTHAAVRELEEETGLDLRRAGWQTSAPRYVPDPRASDEAWMVTVLARCDLGVDHSQDRNEVLPVRGADDAARAAWVHADDYPTLTSYLAAVYRGRLFLAHRDLLAEELDSTREGHA